MRTLARTLLLAAAGPALVLAAPAMAQQPVAPAPSIGTLTGPPIGLPGAGGTSAPTVQRPTPRPGQDASPGSAAAYPASMQGGFGSDPSRPGDPASGMNLRNARARETQIQGAGQERLGEFTKGNFEETPTASLPNAPIVGQSDLENLVKSQRNIRVLNQQVEEAKKAVELWHILFNNEDAKASREKEEKVAETKAKDEDAARKNREAQAAAQAASQTASLVNSGAAMASAIAQLPSVPPKVVEVSGSQALLLVPGKGEVWGRAGADLGGGYKLLSVAPKKVAVRNPKGETETLAFGTTVTSPMIVPQRQMQPPPKPAQMPILPAPRI